MSQANVELVQSWFSRLHPGHRDFSTDELHPDFQVVSRLQDKPFEGREGLHRWMQEVDEQFRDWELVGDEGAMLATALSSSAGSGFAGRGAASGSNSRTDGWSSSRTARCFGFD